MNYKKGEKELLEKYAIKYFLSACPRKLKLLEHSDKPDFTLLDEKNQSKIGVEIAHLWHDKQEAKILLGRSKETIHGIMSAADLIRILNNLLNQKANKITGFKKHDQFFLVVRVASPIFDKSTFDIYENDIIRPENTYNKIYILLDDNNKTPNRWTELREIT